MPLVQIGSLRPGDTGEVMACGCIVRYDKAESRQHGTPHIYVHIVTWCESPYGAPCVFNSREVSDRYGWLGGSHPAHFDPLADALASKFA